MFQLFHILPVEKFAGREFAEFGLSINQTGRGSFAHLPQTENGANHNLSCVCKVAKNPHDVETQHGKDSAPV